MTIRINDMFFASKYIQIFHLLVYFQKERHGNHTCVLKHKNHKFATGELS